MQIRQTLEFGLFVYTQSACMIMYNNDAVKAPKHFYVPPINIWCYVPVPPLPRNDLDTYSAVLCPCCAWPYRLAPPQPRARPRWCSSRWAPRPQPRPCPVSREYPSHTPRWRTRCPTFWTRYPWTLDPLLLLLSFLPWAGHEWRVELNMKRGHFVPIFFSYLYTISLHLSKLTKANVILIMSYL